MAGIFSYPRIQVNFSPAFPPLKKIRDKTQIDVRYSVISPFAFIHIHWDPKTYEVLYEVEEPILDATEMAYKEQIISAMRDMIDFDTVIEKDDEKLLVYIDERFKIIAVELGLNISYETYKKIYYYLIRDFIGFNKVEPLWTDYIVEDVECNGSGGLIYVFHRIYRKLKPLIRFDEL